MLIVYAPVERGFARCSPRFRMSSFCLMTRSGFPPSGGGLPSVESDSLTVRLCRCNRVSRIRRAEQSS